MRYVSAVLGFALSATLLFPAEAPHVFTPAQKSYWALQPVKKSPLPAVKDKAWVKTPIDAFILAKLEENKLQPNPRADKLTLLKRVTIDVTGLPPTQEEIQAFLSEKRLAVVGVSHNAQDFTRSLFHELQHRGKSDLHVVSEQRTRRFSDAQLYLAVKSAAHHAVLLYVQVLTGEQLSVGT